MSVLYSFSYFIFSFVVLSIIGLFVSWIDRKITARIQWRVGPPWYQNFVDIIKLSGKEILISENSNKFMFIFSPILAVTSSTICGSILFLVLRKNLGFGGDLILFVYLLTIPSLSIILGGSSSGNVLASVGISRELKLLLSYELPFICGIIIPAIKANSTTSLIEIVKFQEINGSNILSLSGVIGFIVILISSIGKLGVVPFDLAEAETEIAGGALIEYSGILLGFYKLARAILFFVIPSFIVILYLGGTPLNNFLGILIFIIKYFIILILITLIRNTNPRLRIDQALKFFWGWLTLIGIMGILFVLTGM
ncbi:MAG: NADH-quinone oxidoreductase subunit H [Candidatus Omnitrophica bacterium]|nr:NADH-quinone oxidoreductase subunit H [Candidatus Omnitrophota bacterium]MCM8807781.1 NADH-quinone oxidoreductase subunit H [Candidatus Omnitrophota bacterium]